MSNFGFHAKGDFASSARFIHALFFFAELLPCFKRIWCIFQTATCAKILLACSNSLFPTSWLSHWNFLCRLLVLLCWISFMTMFTSILTQVYIYHSVSSVNLITSSHISPYLMLGLLLSVWSEIGNCVCEASVRIKMYIVTKISTCIPVQW